MEAEIKKWCDTNIAIGMCYGSNKSTTPITGDQTKQRRGKLLYQDGTACSASYAFADVYELDNGEYEVYADCGYACFTGDNCHNEDGIMTNKFQKLSEVVDYLADLSFHDPNSCGDLMYYLSDKLAENTIGLEMRDWFRKKKVPILSKSQDLKLIECIKEYGSRPYNK